jgi:hypothetical protein
VRDADSGKIARRRTRFAMGQRWGTGPSQKLSPRAVWITASRPFLYIGLFLELHGLQDRMIVVRKSFNVFSRLNIAHIAHSQ